VQATRRQAGWRSAPRHRIDIVLAVTDLGDNEPEPHFLAHITFPLPSQVNDANQGDHVRERQHNRDP
jgi:hypothetical protein